MCNQKNQTCKAEIIINYLRILLIEGCLRVEQFPTMISTCGTQTTHGSIDQGANGASWPLVASSWAYLFNNTIRNTFPPRSIAWVGGCSTSPRLHPLSPCRYVCGHQRVWLTRMWTFELFVKKTSATVGWTLSRAAIRPLFPTQVSVELKSKVAPSRTKNQTLVCIMYIHVTATHMMTHECPCFMLNESLQTKRNKAFYFLLLNKVI